MMQKLQRHNTTTGDEAREAKSVQVDAILARIEDTSGLDSLDNEDLDDLWLSTTGKGKERSRIQRQMKARQELERHLEEKRLKQLVDDWYQDD